MTKLFAAVLAPAVFAPAVLAVVALPVLSARAQAQNLNEVFRRANPSVVVIRAKGRDVSSIGVTRFSETGSGVLISADGKVMTAAHVVNAVDEITVEALGGERVPAKIIASEPAADLSLLQLERVPPSMRAARMADSSTVRVGDQVIVIGAPYGLAHSMSAGWISARWPPNTVY
jgi:serine protease Do